MPESRRHLYIGTAGWGIDRRSAVMFPDQGSRLQRYAKVFNCVEINTSFYRDHKPETYKRWADSVPEEFRFSVKLSRYFTHEARLCEAGARLASVITDMSSLGVKLGAILVQIPPDLAFDRGVAQAFFSEIRFSFERTVVFEPRHLSWASPEATELFRVYSIFKVLADPEPCPSTPRPPGEMELSYSRLHGSPTMYWSDYDSARLRKLAGDLHHRLAEGEVVWCVFDNTAAGRALPNAFALKTLIEIGDKAGLGSHRRSEGSPLERTY